MNLIFLGPPGAGKGTMAVKVAEAAAIPHISTGDIFRANIKNKTNLGKKVKAILDSGDLVPDSLTIELVRDRLAREDTKDGFILDGFPRTIPQADALSEMVAIDHAINFVLPDHEVIKRLSGRRIHPASGRTYHVLFNPPMAADKDDVTGEELIQREDDREESIATRLEVYQKQTAPLVEYYRSRDLLIDVDAAPAPEEVFGTLRRVLSL